MKIILITTNTDEQIVNTLAKHGFDVEVVNNEKQNISLFTDICPVVYIRYLYEEKYLFRTYSRFIDCIVDVNDLTTEELVNKILTNKNVVRVLSLSETINFVSNTEREVRRTRRKNDIKFKRHRKNINSIYGIYETDGKRYNKHNSVSHCYYKNTSNRLFRKAVKEDIRKFVPYDDEFNISARNPIKNNSHKQYYLY